MNTKLDEEILKMKDNIINSVRESVMIKSVEEAPKEGMPFGEGVHKVLNYALDLSEKCGLKSVNMDNMIGYTEYGTGDELVVILGHLDIVPEGDGWTYPPYGAEIHNNKIYGRGVLDDKGSTIGSIFALNAIKNLNLPLKRKIRIIFGTNEETNSKGVKYYIQKGEKLPACGFTPDAQYPIINGEKGIVTCTCQASIKNNGRLKINSLKGGTAHNVVPSHAQAQLSTSDKNIIERIKNYAHKNADIDFDEHNMIIKSRGISVHGSTPELGRNAIITLVEFLNKLNSDKDLFTDGLDNFLNFINKKIGRETNGKSLNINLKDDISGEFTLNLGTIDTHNDEVTFKLNMRYPVTKKYEDFINIFKAEMTNASIKILDIKHKKSVYTSPDTDFVKKLQKVYEEKTGGKAELLSIGGGTYAKAMPNIVAFGPIFEGDEELDHMPDEYMEIDKLIKNVQIIAAAMYKLAE